MSEDEHSRSWRELDIPIFRLFISLLIGFLLSYLIPRPVVGVIHLNDAIYSFTARSLIAQIDYARTHREVRAVLLVLDSPGGTVVDTEAVYLELARLRQTKPVVTYVQGMAASGAFYLSVGTDYILSGPSSLIGNVGVIAQMPPDPFIQENTITTGPYKMFGTPRDTLLREIEMIKQGFYQAVTMGRGDRLQIGPDILLTGQIWPGAEALRFGLIDGLGSQTEAVEYAGDMAQISNYKVTDLRDLIDLPEGSLFSFFLETEDGMLTPYPKESDVYLLYIPPLDGRMP